MTVKTVRTSGNYLYPPDLSALPAGEYFLLIFDGARREEIKVVLAR